MLENYTLSFIEMSRLGEKEQLFLDCIPLWEFIHIYDLIGYIYIVWNS